jgi:hypothetical protein
VAFCKSSRYQKSIRKKEYVMFLRFVLISLVSIIGMAAGLAAPVTSGSQSTFEAPALKSPNSLRFELGTLEGLMGVARAEASYDVGNGFTTGPAWMYLNMVSTKVDRNLHFAGWRLNHYFNGRPFASGAFISTAVDYTWGSVIVDTSKVLVDAEVDGFSAGIMLGYQWQMDTNWSLNIAAGGRTYGYRDVYVSGGPRFSGDGPMARNFAGKQGQHPQQNRGGSHAEGGSQSASGHTGGHPGGHPGGMPKGVVPEYHSFTTLDAALKIGYSF